MNPPHESMTMKEGPFMQKYGKEVLALYHIPAENAVEDSNDPDAYTTDDDADSDNDAGGGSDGGDGAAE